MGVFVQVLEEIRRNRQKLKINRKQKAVLAQAWAAFWILNPYQSELFADNHNMMDAVFVLDFNQIFNGALDAFKKTR